MIKLLHSLIYFTQINLMHKCTQILLVLFVSMPHTSKCQNYTSYMTGNPNDTVISVLPAIVLAGGGTDNDDAMKWMLNRARGGDVVVIRASGSDGYNSYFFSELGVQVNSVETILFKNKAAASEPYILDRLRKAELVFIAGGDQGKYYDYWHDTETGEVLKEICLARNKVIGGTSAGQMILGNIVYAPTGDGVTSAEALTNPFHPNVAEIRYDFLRTDIFTNTIFDSHFDNRDRAGRLMVFLAKTANEHNIRARAIACNESTAVCIDEHNIATIFGETPQYNEYAYFIEVNCEEAWKPQVVESGKPVHWSLPSENAVIVQRMDGTKTGEVKFDMNTWQPVTNAIFSHWQINQGVLEKESATNNNCSTTTSAANDLISISNEIYPNPTNSVLNFPLSDIATLRTLNGQDIDSCRNCSSFNLRLFNDGILLLVLQNGNHQSIKKVIKN